MIVITDFIKKYNENIIFEIPKISLGYQAYWIKGPNGIGKSTLLKCMVGLTEYKGRIAINDHTISENRINYLKEISFAEAEPMYPGFMTGQEIINYYIATKSVDKKYMTSTISYFNISHFLNSKICTYSSGMLKKLSLVLNLGRNTNVTLLDEPLITLDSATQEQLLHFIKQQIDEGKQFIITSHQALDIPNATIHELEIVNKQLCAL